jgi:periplasmic protein CpxP/Spy
MVHSRLTATRHGGGRAVRMMMMAMLMAAAAAVSLSAWAQGGHGPHGGHGMWGGGAGMIGPMSDRMLDGLNATDAQRAQIKQIAQAAAADLKAQREAGRALREQAMQVFTAPNVDAAAAESVRQQMLAQHDAASRRMLQAMLDASRVLTPEQRAKLAERMKERSARMQERMQRHDREAPRQ